MNGAVRFHLLPAEDGDCIFVEAIALDGKATTILIDGGRSHTYATWGPLLGKMLQARPVVDLLVVTHIDADHIGGILSMLKDPDRGFEIGRIWFNGRAHVEAAQRPTATCEPFGVAQSDELSRAIVAAALPWNTETEGGPIHCDLNDTTFEVGHFELTILTPTRAKLSLMSSVWERAMSEALTKVPEATRALESLGASGIDILELMKVVDENDNSRPNGSSIGLLVKALGIKLLLAGDCHPNDLVQALNARREVDDAPFEVDLFKLSHHGARKNFNRELLGCIRADIYAVSTNGRHGHPDDSTLAKIVSSLSARKTLAFNYRTSSTAAWDMEELKSDNRYSVLLPEAGMEGHLCIEFAARGS